jgi:phosphoglycolate phosphatase
MLPACVLFDLDGTLIDHFKAIHRCHSHTMTRMGLPAPTMAQVHAAVGGGVELAVERLVGRARAAEALAIYRPYWDATMLDDVELLPGARELLTALRQRGIRTAVFTNKHGPSSRATCAHLGIDRLLDGNFGATDTPWLKPDPAWTRDVLAKLGVTADQTLLVGDSPFDVQTAQRGGLAFIGVTTGTHSAEMLRAAGGQRICAGLPDVARELGL